MGCVEFLLSSSCRLSTCADSLLPSSAIGAVSAPTLAPVVGSFAAEAKNWRWPFLELLWLSGATFIVLFFLLPETLESTILVRRAERLRKLTGNELLKAPAEVAAVEGETLAQNLKVTTQRAFRLAIEPSLAVCHIYIGLVYSIFYLCKPLRPRSSCLAKSNGSLALAPTGFEALPICFGEEYGFSLGISGLPFLAFVVSASVTVSAAPSVCLAKRRRQKLTAVLAFSFAVHILRPVPALACAASPRQEPGHTSRDPSRARRHGGSARSCLAAHLRMDCRPNTLDGPCRRRRSISPTCAYPLSGPYASQQASR